MNTPPIILSIAGSDPSGGAGIQADIKAISALGGYAATAITAITVQNTRGVAKVNYLPPVVVTEQIKAVFNDLNVASVKIGMTGQYDIVKAISYTLIKRKNIPVVLDPVMAATGGRKLAENKAIEALKLFLLPQCKVATPNLLEASILLGKEVRTTDDMKQAAIALWQQFHCAFLLKGGHLEGDEMVDVLFDGQFHYFNSPRIETKNLHGTGCTLSSAIATYLGKGEELVEAITHAKEYIDRAIAAGTHLSVGHGNGPVWHFPDSYPLLPPEQP